MIGDMAVVIAVSETDKAMLPFESADRKFEMFPPGHDAMSIIPRAIIGVMKGFKAIAIINVIAGMGKKCYYWNVPMFFYRIHDNNTIGLSDNMAFKKKNTMEVRMKDAQQAIRVLNFIEKADNVFYNENSLLKKAKGFSFKHVKNLEERNFVRLFLQNFNPCYRKLKTFRGRILDLFFVLNK